MTEKSIARSILNVDFLTAVHRITCQVEVGNTGLVGLLNDVHLSIFTVRNVYVSRLQQPARIIGNFEEASLVKANVALGLLARREDVGPQTYIRVGGTKQLSAHILLATTSYEVRGLVEFTSRLDPDAILVGGTGKYTVLYNATAVHVQYPDTPYTAPAMFVNRSLATGLGAIPKAKT